MKIKAEINLFDYRVARSGVIPLLFYLKIINKNIHKLHKNC